ncbi:MAG: hypothetical protein Q9194_006411 [Teloschistes cf. exilis]
MAPKLVVLLTPPLDKSRSVTSFLESPATRTSFKRRSGLLMEMPSAKRLKVYDSPEEGTSVSVKPLLTSNPNLTRSDSRFSIDTDKLDLTIKLLEETNAKLDKTTGNLGETREMVISYRAWIRDEGRARLPLLKSNALEAFVEK